MTNRDDLLARIAKENAEIPMSGFATSDCQAMAKYICHPSKISFGNCSAPTPPMTPFDKMSKQIAECGQSCEKDNTMYATTNYAIATTAIPSTEDKKLQYFKDRLFETRSELADKLSEQFGMTDAPRPKNPKEFVERIKADKFVIIKPDFDPEFPDFDEPRYYGDFCNYIRFRDPSTKRDSEGYERAYEALSKAFSAAKDQLYAGNDPIKTLADFQAWKYLNA